MSNGIEQVLQRIRAIEMKFSPQVQKNPAIFQRNLQTEMKRQDAQAVQHGKGNASMAPGGIDDMIAEASRKYGVDPKLMDAVARTESNYAPNAVSSAGAVGVMQLMPDTASSLGVTDIYNPRDNIEGGVKYMKQMLNAFDGNVTKAVAAYNAGPQAVKDYNGVPPYAETKNYVQKVLDLYS